MYNIGVVGKREKNLYFMACGFRIYDASNTAEVSSALKKAKNDNCAIIFIEPELAAAAPDELEKYAGSPTPAVIPLPSSGGGYGIEQLKSAVEKAVGADIIFKDNT